MLVLPGGRSGRSLPWIVLSLGLAVVCLPGPALALSQLAIHFDFAPGSEVSLLGGALVTPPDGTLGSASARLRFEADAGGILPGGVVTLSDLAFSGTLAGDVGGMAQVDGSFSAAQVGTLSGVLSAGGDGVLFSQPLQLDFSADLGCTGPGCPLLGLPVAEMGLFALPIGLLPLFDLGVAGSARIQADVSFEVGGVLGELRLLGVETSRTAVAEPGLALLAGVSLAGVALRSGASLAGLVPARRRRARAGSPPGRVA